MTIHEKAVQFLNSVRGRYILGQALHIAVEELKRVPPPYREESNIADMEFLVDELFPMYAAVAQAEKTFRRGVPTDAPGGGDAA
jgi:hypothetical protein